MNEPNHIGSWRKSLADFERYERNNEAGINYLAPKEAKELSPERTDLGTVQHFEKIYQGQRGILEMAEDRKLARIAKELTGRV